MHLLGQLIGLDFSASPHVKDLLGDEQAFRAQAFEAGAPYLRRLSESRPVVVVVVVLDDLHWADAGSLAFMRCVMQRDGDVPLLSLTLPARRCSSGMRTGCRAKRTTPSST